MSESRSLSEIIQYNILNIFCGNPNLIFSDESTKVYGFVVSEEMFKELFEERYSKTKDEKIFQKLWNELKRGFGVEESFHCGCEHDCCGCCHRQSFETAYSKKLELVTVKIEYHYNY